MKIQKQKRQDLIDGGYDFEFSIDSLINNLQLLKEIYGSKYSRLYFKKDCGYDYTYYQLIGEREETDEEAKIRVENANKRKEAQDKQDAALYERLKAKFEPKQS
jgi:hypothetical protein